VLLKNYRKNGELFWNRLSLTPLFNNCATLTHFIGVQTDVTAEIFAKEEAAAAYVQLKEAYAMMEQDLAHASFVQQSILPTKFPQSKSISFAAKFEPMTHIGGDFYDVFEIETGIYGVMIADVTGHGASAALLTLMAYDVFKGVANASLSPKEVLHQTNKKLYKRIPTGKFITMFYGVINEGAQTFTYCQAGHPCSYVIKGEDQSVHELSTNSSLLGVFDASMSTFDEKVMQLNPGDKIVMYTDALIEIKNTMGRYFGSDSLHTFLSEKSSQAIAPLLEQLYQNGLAFIRPENQADATAKQLTYSDDFTLLGFEVKR
jgi:serine phosphatase RsbU (regulator of sigma subunit)